jgi:hypothetical protein
MNEWKYDLVLTSQVYVDSNIKDTRQRYEWNMW